MRHLVLAGAVACLMGAVPVSAQSARDATERASAGTMDLHVDATDLDRRIFRVRQTIPVARGGSVAFRYPEWLPGNHAPRGQVEKVTGLVFRAGGC